MTEVTVGEVALPSGAVKTSPVGRQGQARPRARASVVTPGDVVQEDQGLPVPLQRIADGAVRVAKVTAADVAGAWPWRDSPPALAALLREDPAAQLPEGLRVLRILAVGWRRGVAIPATAVLYTVAWLLQQPTRTIAAGVVITLLTISLISIL